MNRPLRLVIIPLLVVLVALLLGKMLIATKKSPPKKPMDSQVPLVEVLKATPQTYQFNIKSQASVETSRSILVSSDIAAKVVWVSSNYKPGAITKAGELLIKLDDATYRLKLAQAKSSLAEMAISLRNEEAEMRRAKKLGKAIAEARQAKLAQVKSAYRVAELTVQNAQNDLEKTRIMSPVNGVIDKVNIDMGQYVGAGSALFTLLGSDRAEIRLPITSEQMNYIEIPRDAVTNEVFLTANYGEKIYQWVAKTARIEQRVDQSTRVFYLIAELEQPYNTALYDQALWFGMFVNATILGKKLDNVYILPVSAVFNKQYIYRVVDGRLQKQFINILRRVNNYVVVGQGINPADQIVLSRLDLMVDGMPVKTVIKESFNDVDLNNDLNKAAP